MLFTVTSLSDLARGLEARAASAREEAARLRRPGPGRNLRAASANDHVAWTWAQAADIVRRTTIVPEPQQAAPSAHADQRRVR